MKLITTRTLSGMLSIATLVAVSFTAAAQDGVPVRVKTYLDKKYPGWALPRKAR